MLPDTAILAWRATDEQAICASWIGKHAEAFVLFRRLLARRRARMPKRVRVRTPTAAAATAGDVASVI